MKKHIVIFFSCSLLSGVCFGGFAEYMETQFESVVATDDGLFIVLKKGKTSYRYSSNAWGHIQEDETDKKVIANSELGEYFIPYGCKRGAAFFTRHSQFKFTSFDVSDARRGFNVLYVHQLKRIVGTAGTLIYLKSPSPSGRTYEILDQTTSELSYGREGEAITNILYVAGKAVQAIAPEYKYYIEALEGRPPKFTPRDLPTSEAEVPASEAEEDSRFQAPKVGKEVALPDHIEAEPVKTRSSIWRSWKTILPVFWLLLIVTGLVLRRRGLRNGVGLK